MIKSTTIKQENGAVIRIHPLITPHRVGITLELLDDDGQPVFHEMSLADIQRVVSEALELGERLALLELVSEDKDDTSTMLDDLLRRKKEGGE